MDDGEIVLASASPRRRELLRLAGIPHRVMPAAVDERPLPDETPAALAVRAARSKAEAAAGHCPPGCWVLAADTVVAAGDAVLGKPRDADDGARMLRALSGRSHRVLTAVALARVGESAWHETLVESEVTFRTLSEAWIAGYLQTGEPFDKAGAYGIQGLGAMLVRSIRGSYTNVVGLPLCETVELLEAAGAWHPFGGPPAASGS